MGGLLYVAVMVLYRNERDLGGLDIIEDIANIRLSILLIMNLRGRHAT